MGGATTSPDGCRIEGINNPGIVPWIQWTLKNKEAINIYRGIRKSQTLSTYRFAASRWRHINLVVNKIIRVDHVDRIRLKRILRKIILIEGHNRICVATGGRREHIEISKGGRSLLQGRGKELQTLETEGQMLQRVMPSLMGLKNSMMKPAGLWIPTTAKKPGKGSTGTPPAPSKNPALAALR